MEITGAVLCGGKSSRIGMEKAFRTLNGKPIFEQVLEVLEKIFENIVISSNNRRLFSPYGFPVIEDIYKDKDAIGGIYSVLKNISTQYVFVVACDMPFIDENAIRYLINQANGYDVVVPKVKGKYQPLFALYSKNCIDLIERNILNHRLKIVDIIEQMNSKIVSGKELKKICNIEKNFFNINTEDDFLKAISGNFKDAPVIGIVARFSNSGKTTLIENLIKVFNNKEVKISVIKHTFHPVEVDKEGKDSYRFFNAGADAVVINSDNEIVVRKRMQKSMPVKYIKDKFLKDTDMVIIEGHKTGNFAKIELIKDDQKEFLFQNDKNIIGLVSNFVVNSSLPQFRHNEVEKIAEFIEVEILN